MFCAHLCITMQAWSDLISKPIVWRHRALSLSPLRSSQHRGQQAQSEAETETLCHVALLVPFKMRFYDSWIETSTHRIHTCWCWGPVWLVDHGQTDRLESYQAYGPWALHNTVDSRRALNLHANNSSTVHIKPLQVATSQQKSSAQSQREMLMAAHKFADKTVNSRG